MRNSTRASRELDEAPDPRDATIATLRARVATVEAERDRIRAKHDQSILDFAVVVDMCTAAKDKAIASADETIRSAKAVCDQAAETYRRLLAERDEALAEAASLRAEVERLRDVLHRDQTGLAAALNKVAAIVSGYEWATTSRGPYRYDDDGYRREFGRCIDKITKATREALIESGKRAHAHCCRGDRKEP